MLVPNPNERAEADELLKDEYFQVEPTDLVSQFGLEPGSVSSPQVAISDEQKEDDVFHALNNVSTFVSNSNLKRIVISYIVSRKLYDENNRKLIKIFQELDIDNTGSVETKEIYQKYKKFFPGTSEEQWKTIDSLIQIADTNKNGKLDYGEFLTVLSLKNKEMNKKTLREIFDFYDENKNGVIEPTDIREIFEDTGLSDKQIHEILAEISSNGNRNLTFDDFYKLITDGL
mgnify:FL=1